MMKRITGLIFILSFFFASYAQDYDIYESNEWGIPEKTGEVKENPYNLHDNDSDNSLDFDW